jgi:4-hydroxythreonine-4-phosphate dehydrogenase
MKKIAITMGDPSGIGPEVALKAICSIKDSFIPLVVGDPALLEEAAKLFDLPLRLRVIGNPEEAKPDIINLIDVGPSGSYKKGVPTAEGGRASIASIRKALELALKGSVDALVTAPISKEALRMAGGPWPGHTEMLAELTGTKDYAMMLLGGQLRVILVTIHRALKDVPSLITKESVSKTIKLAVQACSMLGIEAPRIGVAGLNPHAGEAGLFGDEEIRDIRPAIEDANAQGIPVTGPYPPDTLFHRAYKGEFDMLVCMYHDQGLIPLKLLAFEQGVNVTVGLPIIRTSPDHGTACDIAWKDKADPSSMIEAIRTAIRLRLVQ